MSRLNGDKSRHQINRKRGVQRREKARELVALAKQKKDAAAAPAKPAKP